jgi:chemotaxis response regulator CheB
VLVVDDSALFRAVVCDIVRATDGFELAGEAESGEAALELTADWSPDLVLLDVRLPGLDGIETARRLLARRPAAAVVLLSTYRPEEVEVARETTSLDVVAKDTLCSDVLRAVWERRPGALAAARQS